MAVQSEEIRKLQTEANNGNANAQYKLGVRYKRRQGVKQDYKEAVRLYRLAAEQGHAIAQNDLGACYDKGQGVKQDYKEAIRLYQLSAEQGCAQAQCNLGTCYKIGQGVKQDYEAAIRFYQLAAKQGKKIAKKHLKKLEQQHPTIFETFILKLANEGNLTSQLTLAQDYTKRAFSYYQQAAEQGDPEGQFQLARRLQFEEKTPKDLDEARRLYRLASDQNHTRAQYQLGRCYENGRGIEQNIEFAIGWYYKAAQKNNLPAQQKLNMVEEQYPDITELVLLTKRAYEGDVASQLVLACEYETGSNRVTINLEKAIQLYRLAADQNHLEAQNRLAIYFKENGLEEALVGLKSNTLKGTLDLRWSQIGDQGISALAKALHYNQSIATLHLEHSNMSKAGLEALINTLDNQHALTEITGVPNDPRLKPQLDNLLARNQTHLIQFVQAVANNRNWHAQTLLEKGFCIHQHVKTGEWSGYTPMMVAVVQDNLKWVEKMRSRYVEDGLRCQAKDRYQGLTAAQIAELPVKQVRHFEQIKAKEAIADQLSKTYRCIGLTAKKLKKKLEEIEQTSPIRVQLTQCQFDFEDWITCFKSLSQFSFIQHLELSDNGFDSTFLTKALKADLLSIPTLKSLNLDRNQFTYKNIVTLVKSFAQAGHLENLSLRENLAEQNDKDILDKEIGEILANYNQKSKLKHVDITGNYFISKGHSKKRLHALDTLLTEMQISPALFSKAHWTRELELKEDDKTGLCFSIDGKEQIYEVPNRVMDILDAYRFEANLGSDTRLFNDLKKGIKPILRQNPDLKEVQLSEKKDLKEKNQICKALLWHHPKAPLKSYLRRDPVLHSEKLPSASSLLFSNEFVSTQNWKVYLFAKKTGNPKKEYTLLGWEGLYNYGQHEFKLACLSTQHQNRWGNRVLYPFVNLSEIAAFREQYYIAQFDVTKTQIKTMAADIDREVNRDMLPTYEYLNEEKSSLAIDLNWAIEKLKTHCSIKEIEPVFSNLKTKPGV